MGFFEQSKPLVHRGHNGAIPQECYFSFCRQKRKKLKLEKEHPALTIFESFKGQTTHKIYDLIEAHIQH